MNKTYNLLGSIFAVASALAPLAARGGEPTAPPQKAEPQALSFPFSYTGEGLGNLSGGIKRGAVYEGLLNIGVQGNLEKLVGWKGASFLVSGAYTHGASLTEKYVHDFNAVSNIDAYDSSRLYEAWLEQELADGKLSIRLGQILADAEFFVSDNAALFINGAFGALPVVSQNLPAPVYPVAAPGVRVRWSASDSFSMQVGVFDGDVGDPAVDNRYGTDWDLNGSDGILAIAEAAWTRNGGSDGTGLRSVFKLGAFYRNSGSGEELNGEPRASNAGGYVVVDQQLWREAGTEDEGLSGFLRVGGAPDDRNTVPFYFDAGYNYKGLIPGRAQDVSGIGLSYTKISNQLCDDDGVPVESHHEAIVELTHKFHVKEWLTIQPDCQYIFNPGACENAKNAFVAGVRFNVSF